MKKLLILISLFVVIGLTANSQIKYPWGEPNTVSLTSTNVVAKNIALASIYDNLTIYTVTCDTSVTINASTLNARLTKGSKMVFIITEATANADTITWGTNIEGLTTKTPSGKVAVVEFMYNGTTFYKVAETQQN